MPERTLLASADRFTTTLVIGAARCVREEEEEIIRDHDTILRIAGPTIEQLQGRQVLISHSQRGFFEGCVESANVQEDKYVVNFGDALSNPKARTFTRRELTSILVPERPQEEVLHTTAFWSICISIYDKIGYCLRNEQARNTPSFVFFVAKRILSVLRYYKEVRCGNEITIDAPLAIDYPIYGTPEFIERCDMTTEQFDAAKNRNPITLQQQSEQPPQQQPEQPPQQQPEQPPQQQPEQPPQQQQEQPPPDIPIEEDNQWFIEDGDNTICNDSGCFNDMDDINAINYFNMETCNQSPFTHMPQLPYSLTNYWGIVAARIVGMLLDAIDSEDSPERSTRLNAAFRWYCAFPQILFRTSRNYRRDTNIIKTRLLSFINGEFGSLLNYWQADIKKDMLKQKKNKPDSIERRVTLGIKLIKEGFMSKGIRIIEGNGTAEKDDENIFEQMVQKHPKENIPMLALPRPPDHSDEIDISSKLLEVLKRNNPKAGVSTRGFLSDYMLKLAIGKFSDVEGNLAYPLFVKLGNRYLNGQLPSCITRTLAAGLLTCLNKESPVEDRTPDGRPIKAEDADTGSFCKAAARLLADDVRRVTIPEQLAIAVPNGIQAYALGFNLLFEKYVANNSDRVLAKIDIKNAHNAFCRNAAVHGILNTDTQHPELQLKKLARCFHSTTHTKPDIYMRSNITENGFKLLCKSESGGGQGNALTGLAFALTINAALKATTERFPNACIKAIHDDITIDASPEELFSENGILSFTMAQLAAAGCKANPAKTKVLASSQEARDLVPPEFEQPFIITAEGEKVYGLDVVGTPIGGEEFVKVWINNKSREICDTIVKTASLIAPFDQAALQAVIHHSLQTRHDYVVSTNLPSVTAQLQADVDIAVATAYGYALTFNPIEDPQLQPVDTIDPSFTADRFQLKTSRSGGGWRRSSNRIGFANMLNQVAPQLLDRIDVTGQLIPGVWNSMSQFFGNHSFDEDNHGTRWSTFLNTESQWALEFSSEYNRLQGLKLSYTSDLPEADSLIPSPLDASLDSFGHGIQKLQKSVFDYMQILATKKLLLRAEKLDKSDPRRMSFVATHTCKFANTLLTQAAFSTVTQIQFSNSEFVEAVAVKFGLPSPTCASILGNSIQNNARSVQVKVDKYGYNLKTVTGAKGNHTRILHDSVVNIIHEALTTAGICHRGGYRNTVTDIFSSCIHHDNTNHNDEDRRKLQGIIPDLLVSGYLLHPMEKPNPFYNHDTLCDVKTLAPGEKYKKMSMEPGSVTAIRGDLVNTQYHKNARELDRDKNGTPEGSIGPIRSKLNSYGINGRVRGLVAGAFGEFSPDVLSLRNLISAHSAGNQVQHINIPIHQAKAIRDMKLTASWGLHLARGWARLLIDRRNDLTSNPCGGNTPAHCDFNFFNQNEYEYYHFFNGRF